MRQLLCKTIRPTTNTILMVKVPHDVISASHEWTDIAQWIGEEFNWQFIAMGYELGED